MAASLALLLLLLAAAPASAGAAAAAPPAAIALLPSVGTAKEEQRRDLDGLLRQALLDDDHVELLSPVETREHLMSLAEMGLVCLPEDVACLVKLGIIANVAVVLVPVGNKAASGKDIDVELSVIDVAASRSLRTVSAHFAADDLAEAKALVAKALVIEPKKIKAPDDHNSGPPPATATQKPLPTGVLVTGVSGAVAVLALTGAVTCDLIYSDALKGVDAKTRQNLVQPVGATLWVTTVLAAAGVGAGVYLMATAPPDDAPADRASAAPAR